MDMDMERLKCVLLYNFSRKRSKITKNGAEYAYIYSLLQYSIFGILIPHLDVAIKAQRHTFASSIVLHLIVQ